MLASLSSREITKPTTTKTTKPDRAVKNNMCMKCYPPSTDAAPTIFPLPPIPIERAWIKIHCYPPPAAPRSVYMRPRIVYVYFITTSKPHKCVIFSTKYEIQPPASQNDHCHSTSPHNRADDTTATPPTFIFFLHPISHRSCIFHFGRPEPFSSTIYSLSISSVGNGFASRSSGHSCLFSFGCATIWCIAFSTRFIGRLPMKNCGFTILLAVDWLCVCLRVWEKETVYGVLLMWLREHFQWYGGVAIIARQYYLWVVKLRIRLLVYIIYSVLFFLFSFFLALFLWMDGTLFALFHGRPWGRLFILWTTIYRETAKNIYIYILFDK